MSLEARPNRPSNLPRKARGTWAPCTPWPAWFAGTLAALLAVGCDPGLLPPEDSAVVDAAGDAGFVGADAGPVDAGADAGDAAMRVDAGSPDAGPPPATPPEEPDDIFFVGNSFTFGGPVPTLVHDLAVGAGHPEPRVDYRALPGRTLQFHRGDGDADGAPNRVGEGWDVVVLQENSLRPTDTALGNPEQFKEDAAWFHDLALMARPECRVVLYETWARRDGHAVYNSMFESPADMQEQLRFHYFDAAGRYIPTVTEALLPRVEVAPVGDAWELQLTGGEPPQLHASDDWHAGAAGQYLNALVIYGTIYGRRTRGLPPIGVDTATAEQLQDSADAITRAAFDPPVFGPPMPIADGAVIRVDVGPDGTDWPSLRSASARVGPVSTVDGAPTSVRVAVSDFDGVQTGGRADNTLGWPGDVSADSLWVGSFDSHAAALDRQGVVTLEGLPAGRYELALFASRTGTDGGRGRLTRYRVGAETRDLDVSENASAQARFEVRPDEDGHVRVEVAVSPAGSARFAYLGAVHLTRLGE
ncbi:MAG: hypothetical protein AB8I08_03995 [Sandaracinaceae bacterium]